MFRLDTNIISELRQVGDGQADAQVTAWVPSADAAHIEFPIHPHRRRHAAGYKLANDG